MTILVVELFGPDFLKGAQNLASSLKPHSVKELRILLNHTNPESANVKAAVKWLRPFLMSNGSVFLISENYNAAPSAKAAPEPGDGLVEQMVYLLARYEMEILKAQTQQNLQTKIFEIEQDITVSHSKTADKAYEKMDAYIRG